MGNSNLNAGKLNYNQNPLYDTVTLKGGAPTSTAIQFFSAHRRGADGVEVTNMDQPGVLQAGERFIVMGLSIEIIPSDPTDLTAITDVQELYRKYALSFTYANKELIVAPVTKYPAGGGAAAAVASGTDPSSAIVIGNGVPAVNAGQFLAPDYFIEMAGNVNFGLQLLSKIGYTPTNDILIRAYLEGVWGRLD